MKIGTERVHPAPEFRAGEPVAVALRQRNVLAALLLTLDYTFGVAGGDGTGTIFGDAAARLLRRVTVSANGQDIQTYSGQFLALYNELFLEETLEQTNPTALADATNQAGRQAVFLLPFTMGHSLNPQAFAFPSAGVKEPALEVHWGEASDLAHSTHAAAVLSISGASTRLVEKYITDPEPPAGAAWVSKGPPAFGPLLIKQREIPIVSTGTVEERLTHLLSGADGGTGHELRAVFIEAFSQGTGGRRYRYANDVVSSVRLSIGSRAVVEETPFDDIRQINKSDYGLSTRKTGLVVLDAAADSWDTRRGKLWNVTGAERPVIRLGVTKQTGDCMVRITTVHTAR